MNAGRLKWFVDLYTQVREQSPSGFPREQDRHLGRRRVDIVKQRPSYDKDSLMAGERFYGETITFIVRQEKKLEPATELVFQGERYYIFMRQPNRDHTELLYCRKKDL